MSVIAHDSGTPKFLAPAPAFDFYELPEIHLPAPESYEQWRLSALVPIYESWFFHQPTCELINAHSEAQALMLVHWDAEIDELWHERNRELAQRRWLSKRPWWLIAW